MTAYVEKDPTKPITDIYNEFISESTSHGISDSNSIKSLSRTANTMKQVK